MAAYVDHGLVVKKGTPMRKLAMACLVAGLLTSPALLAGCNGGAAGGSTVGASSAAGAPDLKALYIVGRKWEYVTTGISGATTQSETQTWEVTAVKDNKATLKITGPTNSSDLIIDLADPDALSKLSGQRPATAGIDIKVTPMGKEKITVKAGEYDADKVVSVVTSTLGSGSVTTSTTWTHNSVGMVKMSSVTKITPAAGSPAMPDLTSGMELTYFK